MRSFLLLAAVLPGSSAGEGLRDLGQCYDLAEQGGFATVINCADEREGSRLVSRSADSCFLLCGFCAVPSLRFGLSPAERQTHCTPAKAGVAPPDRTAIGLLAAGAMMNVSTAHGYQYRAPNATADMAHLLTYMNRADTMALFAQPILMTDFLNEHLIYALMVQSNGVSRNVSQSMWREYVLPFGFLDEKRDLYWRWRPIFHKTFGAAPTATAATTITGKVKALAALIPKAQMQGVVAIAGGNAGDREFISGGAVKWHSGSSPMDMSSQQIVDFGGSCTGTAILLGAVLRSVGIPARVAGCSSESKAAGEYTVGRSIASLRLVFGLS